MKAGEKDSLWLGQRGRAVVRRAMWLSILVFVALSAWVVLGQLIFGLGIELRTILVPSSNIHVFLALTSGAVAVLLAALYFSDFQGMIEPEPDGFFDIFSLVVSRLTMIAIVAILCVMLFEVVMRYVFSKPTLWANELSLWIAGFVFMLAGLYAMQQRSHIRIFIVYDMLPRWARKASDTLSVALIWVFTVALIWGSYNEAKAKYLRWETFGTAWDPPLPATIKPAILLFMVLVAIQALSNLIADWNKAPESHSPVDDIDEAEIEQIRKAVGN